MSLVLDLSGFEALFIANYADLCLSSFRIVQQKDIAEDIVQDVFNKLWLKRNEIKLNVSLKSYLQQRVLKQSLNYLKRFRTAFILDAEFSESNEDDYLSDESLIGFRGVSNKVEEAIRALPEVRRMIFILSRFHKMSLTDIAEELEIPPKTVESQLKKAIRQLSRFLLY